MSARAFIWEDFEAASCGELLAEGVLGEGRFWGDIALSGRPAAAFPLDLLPFASKCGDAGDEEAPSLRRARLVIVFVTCSFCAARVCLLSEGG
jgi:hypothetical protein